MSKPLSDDRCQYTRTNGKRCRTPRMNGHASLCPHHARQHERQSALSPPTFDFQPLTSGPQIALDLLGPIHDFRTGVSINHVLGRLLVLLATDRIPARNAVALAYICQLLLQSLPQVKRDLFPFKDRPETEKALKRILASPSPLTDASKFVDEVVPPVHPAKIQVCS
jgi:hypothetical protein